MVFAILTGVRVYYLSHRNQIHSDETFSYMLAKHNVAYTTTMTDTVLTGEQLSQVPHCDHQYARDIADLYHKNYDPPHASLYYMMLRTALIGADRYAPQSIIIRGGALNMIFWIVAFWLLYMLCRGVDERRWWVVPILLLVAFGNSLSIANTLMVREYQFAEMMLIAMAFVVMRIATNIRKASLKQWLMLIICGVGAMSTGYLNTYFVCLLYIWLIIKSYQCDGKLKMFARICMSGVVTLLLCRAIYLGYFDFISVPNPHTDKAFLNFAGAFDLAFYNAYLKSVFTIPGIMILLLGVLMALVSNLKDLSKNGVYVLVISAFAIFAIVMSEYTSILREVRYTYPFIALSTVWIVGLLARLKYAVACILGFALSTVILISGFTTSPNVDYGWQRMRTQLHDGAVIYKLNNNELAQLSPCVNDTAKYIITKSDSVLNDTTTTAIIAHKNESFDPPRKAVFITGPLYLYSKL